VLYIHLRKVENPPRGVISVAYTLHSGDSSSAAGQELRAAHVGLTFCRPSIPWERTKVNCISAARQKGNPMKLTIYADGIQQAVEPADVVRATLALVQDQPRWATASGEPDGHYWAHVIGHNGTMYRYTLFTKTHLPEVPGSRNISWLRIPTWAAKLAKEIG
jgi:hypothetical protein